jgi:hypothetical protein
MDPNESQKKIRNLLKLERAKPVELPDGIFWKLPDGTIHRKFGPAVIQSDGQEVWYRNGQIHRKNAPAIISKDGHDWVWMKDGKMHREDGPAIQRDGKECYALNGKILNEEEFYSLRPDLKKK